MAAVLLLVAGVAASVVHIPYYAIAPGSAVEVGAVIEVDDGPSFPSDGGFYLTTVRVRRVTLLGALQGWIDPAVDVVEASAILPPDVAPAELREFNLQLMQNSQQIALAVALEHLGIDAVSGTGAAVVRVVEGTPAVGVLEPGATIVAVDGEPVRSSGDAVRVLGTRQPGDEVALTVIPPEGADGEPRIVTVTLGSKPDAPGEALLGVVLRTRDLAFDPPFEVEIGTDQIGGPSAGLAFTLGVLEVLTEGDLTGGHRVAVTGTIHLDGSVGPVGGVEQKTAAVISEGIELFIVPMAEVAPAREIAGDDLRVEGVETLDDALRILADIGGNGLTLELGGAAPA